MQLQDIYEQLSYGELRMLFMGDDDDATEGMPEESFKKLFPIIQTGLTALHQRLLLREGTTTVTLVDGKVSYLLPEKDIMKIERVYGTWNSKEYEIPLNIIKDGRAIRTTSFNTMLIPDDEEKALWLKETTELRVVYRADHPEIKTYIANASPLITEIFLPASCMEPLLFYVASRIHNPIGMTPGAMHEGNNYFEKFQLSVQALKDVNLEVDTDDESDKLECRGFA